MSEINQPNLNVGSYAIPTVESNDSQKERQEIEIFEANKSEDSAQKLFDFMNSINDNELLSAIQDESKQVSESFGEFAKRQETTPTEKNSENDKIAELFRNKFKNYINNVEDKLKLTNGDPFGYLNASSGEEKIKILETIAK